MPLDELNARDVLASQIIAGLMTNQREYPNPYDAARLAYQYADAMIKVRNEPK